MRQPFTLLLLASLGVACGGTESPEPGADTSADVDTTDATDGTDTGDGSGDASEACPEGEERCDGVCVAVATSMAHCGGCGQVCPAEAACEGGECVCPEFTERCGAACVDTQRDEVNCGECGTTCGAAEVCERGRCVLDCEVGLVECAAECVDTGTSVAHCGDCDNPCVPGFNEEMACVDGACVGTCLEGFYDLDPLSGCEYDCQPLVPGEDVCDGEDNNCNGLTDANDPTYADVLCPLQLGVCAGTINECEAGEQVGCEDWVYEFNARPARFQAGAETRCDEVDNNCDGGVDEDCCTADELPLTFDNVAVPGDFETFVEGTPAVAYTAEAAIAVAPYFAGAVGDLTAGFQITTVLRDGTVSTERLAAANPSSASLVVRDDAVELWYAAGAQVYLAMLSLRGELGTPVEQPELSAMLGGNARELVVREDWDGNRVIAARVDTDGAFDELRLARYSRSGSRILSQWEVTDTALDIVFLEATEPANVLCTVHPSVTPNNFVCYSLDRVDSTLLAPGSDLFAATAPVWPEANVAFVAESETSSRAYFGAADGAVQRLDLTTAGVLTVSPTVLVATPGPVILGAAADGTSLMLLVTGRTGEGIHQVELLEEGAAVSYATFLDRQLLPAGLGPLGEGGVVFFNGTDDRAETFRVLDQPLAWGGEVLCR